MTIECTVTAIPRNSQMGEAQSGMLPNGTLVPDFAEPVLGATLAGSCVFRPCRVGILSRR